MSHKVSRTLLWLFVINLGMAFGAGLYEHRIVVPDWISSDDAGAHWNAEAARRDNTGLRFWAYVTTGPLTLLTLANLVAAWKASGAIRGWWLAAALTILADRILTFSVLHPNNDWTDGCGRFIGIGRHRDTMGEFELSAPCSGARGMACGAQGILVVPARGIACFRRRRRLPVLRQYSRQRADWSCRHPNEVVSAFRRR